MKTQYLRRTPKPWTAQEVELAEQLIAAGADEATCPNLLGRTKQACRDRMRRVSSAVGHEVSVKLNIPPEVWDERNRRLMAAPRDLTGAMFNDPPIGFSMLEKRA